MAFGFFTVDASGSLTPISNFTNITDGNFELDSDGNIMPKSAQTSPSMLMEDDDGNLTYSGIMMYIRDRKTMQPFNHTVHDLIDLEGYNRNFTINNLPAGLFYNAAKNKIMGYSTTTLNNHIATIVSNDSLPTFSEYIAIDINANELIGNYAVDTWY